MKAPSLFSQMRKLDCKKYLQVSGLSTNVAFLKRLCQHPAFEAAELDTSFIAKHMDDLIAPAQPGASVLALAAVAWHLIRLRVGCTLSLTASIASYLYNMLQTCCTHLLQLYGQCLMASSCWSAMAQEGSLTLLHSASQMIHSAGS